jgi:hypothetical protein
MNHKANAPLNKIPCGIYTGETDTHAGYFKLEVKKGMTFQFQHIVSLHLPPQILENISGQIIMRDEHEGMLDPCPKAILEHISYHQNKTIIVVDRNTGNAVNLMEN